MRRMATSLAVLILLVLTLGSTVLADDTRIGVAVMDFEDAQIQSNRWWKTSWEVGKQFTELITNELIGKGNFKVIERTRLEQILREQNLQTSGRVDTSTAVEMGKLLGVRILILGSVTDFNMTGVSGLTFGGFGIGVQKASVKLTGRIVDTQTGEILGAISGGGTATGATLAARLHGIGFATSEFQETTLGKASTQAVDQFVSDLTNKIESSSARLMVSEYAPRLTGTVVALIPGGIIIDAGQNRGVKKGQVFQVFRLQPVPGLSQPVRVPVGKVSIISVDAAASVATFTEKTTEVQVGDTVEAQ